MQAFEVSVKKLKPHPKNPREHDAENIKAIMKSLDAFGQRTPLVIWKGYVLKGCGTLEAAKRLGWKKVLCVDATDHLSEEQALAYAIADNRTTDMSSFDYDTLQKDIRELHEKKFDLASTGFLEYELSLLLGNEETARNKYNASPWGKKKKARKANIKLDFTPEMWAVLQQFLRNIRKHCNRLCKEPARSCFLHAIAVLNRLPEAKVAKLIEKSWSDVEALIIGEKNDEKTKTVSTSD